MRASVVRNTNVQPASAASAGSGFKLGDPFCLLVESLAQPFVLAVQPSFSCAKRSRLSRSRSMRCDRFRPLRLHQPKRTISHRAYGFRLTTTYIAAIWHGCGDLPLEPVR